MSKYFKEETLHKFKLSEYLEKDESEFKGCLFTEEPRIARTKYIMEILGDISLDKPTYELFIKQFQCFGGRYDVRTKPDTIKGIYEIQEKYPFLTADALDEIQKNGKEYYKNNCIEHTRSTFEKSTLTSEYIELYSQLCEEK